MWMGRLKSIHDFWQGDTCIVEGARLVSVWRDTCNYNVRMRPFSFMSGNLVFCDKAKLSLESIVFGGLGTGEASVALSPFFEVAG